MNSSNKLTSDARVEGLLSKKIMKSVTLEEMSQGNRLGEVDSAALGFIADVVREGEFGAIRERFAAKPISSFGLSGVRKI